MRGHYLPEMYLTRFTVSGRLYVYDRTTNKLRRDKPRNVAAITDYYVVTSASGERDESVEHGFLSGVESAAAPLLKQLAECQSITNDEHDVLATFIALMCTRVPAFETTHTQFRTSVEPIPEAAMRSERIKLMIELAEPLIIAFKAMDWWLLRAVGKRRFVASDAPMGLIRGDATPAAYGELSPDVLRFLAVSPDVCLLLADRRSDQPCLLVKRLDDDAVADVNAAIATAAIRLVISHDRDELETILGETRLRHSTFTPRTVIVEWRDALEGRFGLSVRLHHDMTFPLELVLPWQCRSCEASATHPLYVGPDGTAARAEAYTEWLDSNCPSCGQTARQTGSQLGEDVVEFVGAPK